MKQRKSVLETLKKLGIPYQLIEHPAMYTVPEMESISFPEKSVVVKNLFLRNAKKTNYYLLVTDSKKKINLKTIQQQIGSTRLSFASEMDLQKYLGVTTGAVSPLGLLNDFTHEVILCIDEELAQTHLIGVHPNDNTATIFLSFNNLLTVIEQSGHTIQLIELT